MQQQQRNTPIVEGMILKTSRFEIHILQKTGVNKYKAKCNNLALTILIVEENIVLDMNDKFLGTIYQYNQILEHSNDEQIFTEPTIQSKP